MIPIVPNTQIFTSLEALVPFAQRRAQRAIYDGRDTPFNRQLMRWCGHIFSFGSIWASLIYTRDAGHHMNGWWKNPDYERCLHLSVSYRIAHTKLFLAQDRPRSEALAKAFFGAAARLCWVEPPAGAEGKSADVYHYRLFCDPAWQPILPKGEVYSRENTPAGWKSFSELHGVSPTEVHAPSLTAAPDSGEA